MQIICKDLSIGYSNSPIHEHINFSVSNGSYTCVIGENGVGKSTLIKTLLGLIPPLSGSIIIENNSNGTDIGYLPQQTQVQKDFPASVFEVALSGCLNKIGLRPFYTKGEKQLTRDMLDKLGMLEYANKSYSELSGGQQQRVLLARALCATNKILLLDEPTAGLDMATTSDFYRLIKELNQEGITIIMITHNLNDAIADADYILCVESNEIKYLTKSKYQEGAIRNEHY
ncbi:MAG: ABC transporter ATP-binding protein [Eubacteriales bacterium]